MSSAAHMTGRHAKVLAELAELGLVLARDLHARALAAEDLETASKLSMAFHRISRSVRQTLALEAKLERDRHKQVADAQAGAAREADVLRKVRKARIRVAIERLVWSEAEEDEADHLLELLDPILDEAAISPAFLEGSIDTHIQRIRQELGLGQAVPPS